jgi:hypothetical protein
MAEEKMNPIQTSQRDGFTLSIGGNSFALRDRCQQATSCTENEFESHRQGLSSQKMENEPLPCFILTGRGTKPT